MELVLKWLEYGFLHYIKVQTRIPVALGTSTGVATVV